MFINPTIIAFLPIELSFNQMQNLNKKIYTAINIVKLPLSSLNKNGLYKRICGKHGVKPAIKLMLWHQKHFHCVKPSLAVLMIVSHGIIINPPSALSKN